MFIFCNSYAVFYFGKIVYYYVNACYLTHKNLCKELCKKHGLSNFIYTFGLFRNIHHIHFHNGL